MKSSNSQIPKEPKKVGWANKHCILCKKHGGPYKSHKTCDCHLFNKDNTPIKNRGVASRPHPIKKGPKGINFTQLMRADEIKNTLCKHRCQDKNRHAHELDSDNDFKNST